MGLVFHFDWWWLGDMGRMMLMVCGGLCLGNGKGMLVGFGL